MDIFYGLGLWGMLASSFLAATILPLGSEVVLGYLLLNGYQMPQVVAVATLGNVMGSVVNYYMGLYGGKWLVNKVGGLSEEGLEKAQHRFRRWGTASLLLAWTPVIGDPLTIAAGTLRINIWAFLVLVTIGKLGRYLVLAGALHLF